MNDQARPIPLALSSVHSTSTFADASTIRVTADLLGRLVRKIGRADSRGCWPWLGAKSAEGYGYILVSGRVVPAHRVTYTLWNGEIPPGLTLDHLCRVHGCVRPTHLEPVTTAENSRRGREWRRLHAEATA